MANYEDDEEEELDIEEPNDSDFANKHGESATWLLCNQKVPNTTQRHQIFYSRYSIKSEICNIIIDNEGCENIVFRALVDYLKLETELHRHLYTIGWIKKAPY